VEGVEGGVGGREREGEGRRGRERGGEGWKVEGERARKKMERE